MITEKIFVPRKVDCYREDTLTHAGFIHTEMRAIIESEGEELDAQAHQNRQEQLTSGHWGASLFVHDGEIYFGQDRIDDFMWHLDKHGTIKRF